MLVVPVLVFLSWKSTLCAQTARELLDEGGLAFSGRDYARAEARFSCFVRDYGASPEAADSLEPALRLLGVSQLKLEKFGPALETMERYLKAYPQGSKVEDFTFWLGVARLKNGDPAGADASFKTFLQGFPQSPMIQGAKFSRGLCLLQQGKFKETADYYGPLFPDLKEGQAYQARIIRLYALVQNNLLEEASRELAGIDPQSEAAGKIVAYHLLALDLGNRLLEKEEYRRALGVFQRVWSRPRILARQKGRLDKINREIAALEAVASTVESSELLDLKELRVQVGQETLQLEKMSDYDTALRFRIGQCFLRLDRPREAYLILKEMQSPLPESDLLASASHTMLVCLTRMERWEELVVAAADFEKRYPMNKELPNVLYLRAEALHRLRSYPESQATFLGIAQRFPGHGQSPRCLFMAGYTLLMQDKNKEAYDHFGLILKNQPSSPWAEQTLYWQCMSLHFAKDYENSRQAFGEYLKQYPKGRYQADATFRRAQALFNGKKMMEAYKELEAFLVRYPEATVYDEACNLLGDCYLALGEVERGLEAYRKLSGKDKKLSDYAVFRAGQVYKAREDYEGMRNHFDRFIRERPDSPRLTEALAQLAWIYRRLDQPEKARTLYWEAVQTYGNDPEAAAVEDMLKNLSRLYRQPEEKKIFEARLSETGKAAIQEKKQSLAARVIWMQAALLEKSDPEMATKRRLEIPSVTQPRELSACLLADTGDALRGAKRWEEAANHYKTILSWYPGSLHKERAYAGLGLVALSQDRRKEALEYFARFEKESSQSPLLAEVLRSRASLYLERSEYDEAARELERLLEVPAAKGKLSVEALYQIGEIKLKQKDPKRAIPYFQRIYVMYGKWTDYVAKAYWESGQAFEQLGMKSEATNTYKEFISQDHLGKTPEYAKARERLRQTGGA